MSKKPKLQTKSEQIAYDEYLTAKFADIARGQKLIPVVLDIASWETIKYSIELALKLKYKRTDHGNKETKSSKASSSDKKRKS